MLEQQLCVSWTTRYLPSQLRPSQIQQSSNCSITTIESEFRRFCEEYNESIKQMPDECKQTETVDPFAADVNGTTFDDECPKIIQEKVRDHGSLVSTFKFPAKVWEND